MRLLGGVAHALGERVEQVAQVAQLAAVLAAGLLPPGVPAPWKREEGVASVSGRAGGGAGYFSLSLSPQKKKIETKDQRWWAGLTALRKNAEKQQENSATYLSLAR